MDVPSILRRARDRAGLTLRALAWQAETSHSTIAAYEAGRKAPNADTLERILRAAGFQAELHLVPTVGGPDPAARGRELAEVLELAEQFPARHEPGLAFPVFGRS
ncbi:MAG: helix-turn-helix transcriptional regulator [Acidimicrobiales bacterium]|nr:helix-turn-helix transcriptional regulator [Acidimicrobiales bacterium]